MSVSKAVKEKLKAIATAVAQWCQINKMRLNSNKCKVMSVASSVMPDININGYTLEL